MFTFSYLYYSHLSFLYHHKNIQLHYSYFYSCFTALLYYHHCYFLYFFFSLHVLCAFFLSLWLLRFNRSPLSVLMCLPSLISKLISCFFLFLFAFSGLFALRFLNLNYGYLYFFFLPYVSIFLVSAEISTSSQFQLLNCTFICRFFCYIVYSFNLL